MIPMLPPPVLVLRSWLEEVFLQAGEQAGEGMLLPWTPAKVNPSRLNPPQLSRSLPFRRLEVYTATRWYLLEPLLHQAAAHGTWQKWLLTL